MTFILGWRAGFSFLHIFTFPYPFHYSFTKKLIHYKSALLYRIEGLLYRYATRLHSTQLPDLQCAKKFKVIFSIETKIDLIPISPEAHSRQAYNLRLEQALAVLKSLADVQENQKPELQAFNSGRPDSANDED